VVMEILNKMKLCKCGCGKEVTKENNNYLVGHWNKNKLYTKKTKNKMSISALKKFINRPELRKKCGYSKLTYKRIIEKYDFFWEVEEIKEDENGEILVKCKFCNKFFKPSGSQLGERIRSLKKPLKNIHNYFYCSEECKKSCRYYNRHIDINNYDLNKFNEYCTIVDSETKKTILKYRHLIKNIELRGKKYGYEIDHKYSKTEGFKNNTDPLVISNWRNLEILTVKKNSIKKGKCSITIEELLSLIERDKNDRMG